jgi:hypothetical protein
MALLDDLQAYWELGEASGTRNDSHGTNHLGDNNSVAQAAGMVGNCADFELTSSQYLSIADNAALSVSGTNFSIALWVRFESLPSIEGLDMDLVSKFETSTDNREYRVYAQSSNERFAFAVSRDGAVTSDIVEATSPTIVINTWYFVVAWYDGSNLSISVDNGSAFTASFTAGVFNGNSPLHLGSLGRAAAGLYFDGRLDQVGIWKQPLDSTERSQLWNSGAGLSYAALSSGGSTPQPAAGALTLAGQAIGLGFTINMPDEV